MRRFLSILLLTIFLSNFANPFVNNLLSIKDTNAIYVYADTPEEDEPPGLVEKNLSRMFNGLTTLILYLMDEELDVSLDKLVYNKQSTLKVSFEEGNAFGECSSTMYSIFQYIAQVCMFIALINMGIKTWLNSVSENRKNFKLMIQNYLIAFVFILLLPILIEDLVYIRDLILNALAPETLEGLSYVDGLKTKAYESLKLGDSLMYATTVGITLWFTFVYGAMALQNIWLFVLGPIMAVFLNGNRSRSVFDRWFMDYMSLLSIPLMDAGLLFIVTGLFQGGLGSFWGMVFSASIIPTRSMVRKYLGIGGGWAEMMGMSALMGAAGLTKSVVSTARGGVSTIHQGIQDGKHGQKIAEGGEGSVFSDSYTNSFHQPKVGPKTSDEWRKQGRQKVGRGMGRMALGAVGGMYGFGVTAGLGPGVGMYGASMGMEVGGLVGEGAGHVLGSFSPSNMNQQSVSSNSKAEQTSTGLTVSSNTSTMPVDNVDYSYTTMPSTAVGEASSTSMDSVKPDMARVMHVFNDLNSQPLDGDFLNSSHEKSSEYANSKVNISEITSLRDNIAGNYYNDKVKSCEEFDIEYSVDDLQLESMDYANNQLGYADAVKEYNIHVDFANNIQKLGHAGNQLKENDYMKQFPGLSESIVQNSMNNVIQEYNQELSTLKNQGREISANDNVM